MKGLPLLVLVAAFPGAAFGDESNFIAKVSEKIESIPAIRGDDPEWYFPTRELRHLSKGRFWEQPWEEVASNKTDPLPGMVEFHEALEARDVRLLIVPVPAKGAIYPERLIEGARTGDAPALAPFIERMNAAGLEVLDLEPVFLAARQDRPDALVYCRQDAHFSPRAAAITAGEIKRRVTLTNPPAKFVAGEKHSLSITGDLIAGTDREGLVPPERLEVQEIHTGSGTPIEPDSTSPIILLGDSHILVFHEGKEAGMHCRGAGVFEQLALHYGNAPDLVGVRGSGLVQARKQLFYHASEIPGYWDSKKLVVWLFSVREFTQSSDKPVSIPLTR